MQVSLRFAIILITSIFLFFPRIASAEIFYIMPRIGLNVNITEKGSITNGISHLKPDGTSTTFIASLAGGVHFSRVPLRFELDVSFRTDSTLKDSYGSDFVKVKLFQLSPMINAFYDIYIPNFSIVPYVGIGIGFTAFFADSSARLGSASYTSDALSSVGFTWGMVAGISVPIDKYLLDFAFRFSDAGKAKIASGGLSGKIRSMNIDFLFGVRFPL